MKCINRLCLLAIYKNEKCKQAADVTTKLVCCLKSRKKKDKLFEKLDFLKNALLFRNVNFQYENL